MERSLILLMIITLVLGMAGAAIGQTYYGNSYPGQAQTYLPYGQQYGQQGYGQQYGAPAQYAQPQYQQYSPYYGNYNDYVLGNANPQAGYYQQTRPTQPSQPNPYYGMSQHQPQPQRQAHAHYQSQPAQPQGATSQRRQRTRASAGYASNSIPSIEEMFRPGTPSASNEIYWDPNTMPETPEGAVVTPYQPNRDPRRARISPQNNLKPQRKKRPRAKRRAARSVPKPPESKSQAIKWGKKENSDKPAPPERSSITWGKKKESAQAPKEDSPKPTVMKWGKQSTDAPSDLDVDREPQVKTRAAQTPGADGQARASEGSGQFSWGKKN